MVLRFSRGRVGSRLFKEQVERFAPFFVYSVRKDLSQVGYNFGLKRSVLPFPQIPSREGGDFCNRSSCRSRKLNSVTTIDTYLYDMETMR